MPHEIRLARSGSRSPLASLPGDARGAEGANKILIVALVAIPLILVLVFFGGEVLEYLRNAWEGLHGQEVASDPAHLFDDEDPGGDPAEEDIPEEETEEEKRARTVEMVRRTAALYWVWVVRGGSCEPPEGTGMEGSEYLKAGTEDEVVYTSGAWVVVDPYRSHILCNMAMLACDRMPPSEIWAVTASPNPDVMVRWRPGPDGAWGTEDDLEWVDSLVEPPPEGWVG